MKSLSLSVLSASASLVSCKRRILLTCINQDTYIAAVYSLTCIDEDSSFENESWLSESLISSILALNIPLLFFFLQTGLKQMQMSEHQYILAEWVNYQVDKIYDNTITKILAIETYVFYSTLSIYEGAWRVSRSIWAQSNHLEDLCLLIVELLMSISGQRRSNSS